MAGAEIIRQALGGYGAEVIEGLRIGPQTKASYEKTGVFTSSRTGSHACRSRRSPAWR